MGLNTTVDMNVSLNPVEEQLHMNPAHWTFNTVLHTTMTISVTACFSACDIYTKGKTILNNKQKTLETLLYRTRVVVTYRTHTCTLKTEHR